jgi:hypothetical protein
MIWTLIHQMVLEDYTEKVGMPALGSEAAREWTFNLAEQFAFSFPNENWGTKRASPTRPPSTDVICIKSPFEGWDVIRNQGIPSQTLNNLVGHYGESLTGQVFIPVKPIDHIGPSNPIPEPEPEPEPKPCPEPPLIQPLKPILDKDLLIIADRMQLKAPSDYGGIVNAGSYFGQRVQAGYSVEDAMKETMDWITHWYGE